MLRAAHASRAIVHVAIFGLHELNKFFEVVGLDGWVNHQDHASLANQGNGLEVFDQVVRNFFVNRDVGGNGGRADEQGVTIGLGLHDVFNTDVAACTQFVFDHQGLTQNFTDTLAKVACQQIGATTCRHGNHHLNRLAWEGLSLGSHAAQSQKSGCC